MQDAELLMGSKTKASGPELGLVCITEGTEIRYKVLTRARYLKMTEAGRREALETLYRHNLGVVDGAIDWCGKHGVRLYRVTSQLLPFSDDALGMEVLEGMAAVLKGVGDRVRKAGVRVLVHPDQFVVLSSDRPEVIKNSVTILERHARAFDLMGMPENTWAAINIHGGKGDREERLVSTIRELPDNIRKRLTLENDDHAYGVEEIHRACVRAGVPMVFDAHHHLVREKLAGYDDASIGEWTRRARETWAPHEEWQVVHISNGKAGLHDCTHHDLVEAFPGVFWEVPWVEVEAKAKERAIAGVRALRKV